MLEVGGLFFSRWSYISNQKTRRFKEKKETFFACRVVIFPWPSARAWNQRRDPSTCGRWAPLSVCESGRVLEECTLLTSEGGSRALRLSLHKVLCRYRLNGAVRMLFTGPLSRKDFLLAMPLSDVTLSHALERRYIREERRKLWRLPADSMHH